MNAAAPDACRLELLREIAMHEPRHLDDRTADRTRKWRGHVRRLARLFRVDADHTQELVDGAAQLVHAGPLFGGNDVDWEMPSPLPPNPSPARGEGRMVPLTPNSSPARGEGGLEHLFDDVESILSTRRIDLVSDQQRPHVLNRVILLLRRLVAREDRLDLCEPIEHRLRRERPVIVAEVEHQDRGVGGSHDAADVALHVVGRDRRRVDELHLHVLPIHHADVRLARRERERGHLRCCTGKPRQQPALARVRSADDHILPGPLPGKLVADADLLRMLLRLLDLVLELAHLRLEIGLQFLARFVLRYEPKHFLQASELLLRRLRLLVFLFGFVILGGEVGCHNPWFRFR